MDIIATGGVKKIGPNGERRCKTRYILGREYLRDKLDQCGGICYCMEFEKTYPQVAWNMMCRCRLRDILRDVEL